jgi:hypothetical protein
MNIDRFWRMMNDAIDLVIAHESNEQDVKSAIEVPVRRVRWRNHIKMSSDEVIPRAILAFGQGPKLLKGIASVEW